jgi:hypothetical protein
MDLVEPAGVHITRGEKAVARTRDEINKSQAIREALKANPDKSPSEIAELLKAKGIEVNGPYVSTIKTNMRKTRRAVRKMRRGIRRAGRLSRIGGGNATDNGLAVMNAAIEYMRIAGGLEQAKAALTTIEQIGKAMQ